MKETRKCHLCDNETVNKYCTNKSCAEFQRDEKESKTFVIGDIHGNYKGLMQALERSEFDYEKDTLISLGDIVDGHKESYEVVEELLKIKNLVVIRGNHDNWFYEWIKTGLNPSRWKQGQDATALSYIQHMEGNKDITVVNPSIIPHLLKPGDIPVTHVKFFEYQVPYLLTDNNQLFVHGGFNRHLLIQEQEEFIFMWDRDLWSQALSFETTKGNNPLHKEDWKPKFKMKGNFKEVFIGHTSTEFWGKDVPMKAANIWNLDTGGGWFGKITIMDIDSKEYWQSDRAEELYPEFEGRRT